MLIIYFFHIDPKYYLKVAMLRKIYLADKKDKGLFLNDVEDLIGEMSRTV